MLPAAAIVTAVALAAAAVALAAAALALPAFALTAAAVAVSALALAAPMRRHRLSVLPASAAHVRSQVGQVQDGALQ